VLPLGKLRNETLKEIILPNLGIKNSKIVVGPKEGFDAAVLEYDDDHYLVIATDPILGVPFEHFGFFAYHFASSDVSTFGARSKWLVVDLLLPKGTTKEELNSIIMELNNECKAYNSSIVGGHTGVYPSVNEIVATTTALGLIKKEELKLPIAKAGDDIIITKGLGIEFAVGLAYFKEKELKNVLSISEIAELKEMYKLETVVKDALIAKNFARGMHDVTEGGLASALHEIADNSNLGFKVHEKTLYVPPLVKKVLETYEVNPLTVSSTGTLVIISPKEKSNYIIKELNNNGIKAFVIGEFTEEKERVLIREEKMEEFPKFEKDPYAEIYL